MKNYIFLSIFLLSILQVFAQQPQFPFPNHTTYTSGTIKPVNHTQQQLDDAVRNFYDEWKARYLRNNCAANEYYIWDDEDAGAGGTSHKTICVSEGQGYGFLIVPLMAGYDKDAHKEFNGLYHFYKAHPSSINSTLMDWAVRKDCAGDTASGIDAATDGDLDMAFGLLLADKQWGSDGAINYKHEAINYINAILESEVNPELNTMLLGDWSSPHSKYYVGTRSSDFILDHFRAFAQITGNNKWNKVLNKCYDLIKNMQTNFSPNSGLLPDFIEHCDSVPVPADPHFLEGRFDGEYTYNACRDPWRIATDYLLFGDEHSYNVVKKINNFIRNATNNDASKIHSGYYLNGSPLPNTNYQAPAFIGPFAVSAMTDAKNQNWLNNVYDVLLEQKLKDNQYYDNTLKILCLIVISGNYWSPINVTDSNKNIANN